jgi:hypothetical protein
MEMTSQELLDIYAAGPRHLEERLAGIPSDRIDFRPDYEGAWSIKEHVIHLVDSDLNGFIRLKSIIAQSGTDCYVMDEEVWTKNLRGFDEDLGKYLGLFRLEREIARGFIEPVLESCQGYFTRTYKGETKRIDLREGLLVYVKHLAFHLDYLDRLAQG